MSSERCGVGMWAANRRLDDKETRNASVVVPPNHQIQDASNVRFESDPMQIHRSSWVGSVPRFLLGLQSEKAMASATDGAGSSCTC
ncbi:hypothetical protein PAXRUDRAFT_829443 [Paxillus rubicundulus Ve08.2h10]|uniref:Uncharacterized protein n=1 Tax=Paxillus rubicundulus Ve08.2h10 TaxID=930991 RepID=A0A0D0DUV1_9AGAM|nr:hypothetical protein PAXRUDRAFT_829443 [Paxillus rubicundulus Ve08.2h10]